MKLKYLGTAAAEAIPAIFCSCATCIQARATGGKDVNYEESHRIYEKEGFIMAYDGLEVEA